LLQFAVLTATYQKNFQVIVLDITYWAIYVWAQCGGS